MTKQTVRHRAVAESAVGSGCRKLSTLPMRCSRACEDDKVRP